MMNEIKKNKVQKYENSDGTLNIEKFNNSKEVKEAIKQFKKMGVTYEEICNNWFIAGMILTGW